MAPIHQPSGHPVCLSNTNGRELQTIPELQLELVATLDTTYLNLLLPVDLSAHVDLLAICVPVSAARPDLSLCFPLQLSLTLRPPSTPAVQNLPLSRSFCFQFRLLNPHQLFMSPLNLTCKGCITCKGCTVIRRPLEILEHFASFVLYRYSISYMYV